MPTKVKKACNREQSTMLPDKLNHCGRSPFLIKQQLRARFHPSIFWVAAQPPNLSKVCIAHLL